MTAPRILWGRALLDRVPYWLALPAGVVLGLYVGYRASMPDLDGKRLFATLALLGVIGVLAHVSPRPARVHERSAAPPGVAEDPTGGGEAVQGTSLVAEDDLGDESLCD